MRMSRSDVLLALTENCCFEPSAIQLNIDMNDCVNIEQESLVLARMARDDPPTSSMASSTAATMRSKVGSEFET